MTIIMILSFIFGIALFLLLSPISIDIRHSAHDQSFLRIRIRPFPWITVSLASKQSKTSKIFRIQTTEVKKAGVLRKIRGWRDIKLISKILKELLILALNSLGSFERKEIKIKMTGGVFGDPCLTGIIYGLCQFIREIIPRQATFAYEPDFLSDWLSISLYVSLEFRLATFIKNLIVFFIRIPKLELAAMIFRR